MHLHLDFETKSKVDLKRAGLDRYARHKSTRVLMLGYAVDNFAVHLWEPHKGPMPERLRALLENPNVEIVAFNAAFERAILLHVLGIDVPIERFICAQAMCCSLALPDDLDRAIRNGLRLDEKYCKDARGEKLIQYFCKPNKQSKKRPWEWNDWENSPAEWEEFCAYCCQDVVAERVLYNKLLPYLPDIADMRRLWAMAQRINERGVFVDMEIARGAQIVADKTKAILYEKMQAISGLENPDSPAQVLKWVSERGYPYNNMRKERVAMALDKDIGERQFLTPECIEFLELRQLAAKTSVTKLAAIERAVGEGSRLRHMFAFRKAGRTGRYGGRVVQLQNLARPAKEVEKYLAQVREMLREADYESIAMLFTSPLDVVSSSIRSVLCAPPGKKLVVADLSAIELAVLAWLTGCKFWLDVLRQKLDPYKAFGVHFLKKAYDQINKMERNWCKPGALGAGYRLGGGFLRTDKNGDIVKTGLWGYAESLGVKLTQKQAAEAVRVYRELSPEIVNFWYDLEGAVLEVIRDKQPRTVRGLVIDIKAPFLRIRLPSGRRLHYLRPKIQNQKILVGMEADGKTPKYTWALNMTYEGLDQNTKQWRREATHGGKLTENVVQAIALDVLNEGLEAAEEEEFETVLDVHDEIGTECHEDDVHALPQLVDCMTRIRKPWMEGLPLSAAGYVSQFYKKD
jgi:DNA polymerase